MGSPCLFTRQRALKMGYFYCLRHYLHTELSLGYPKDRGFYLKNKASFIDDDDDDLYFALFTLNLHYICRSKL